MKSAKIISVTGPQSATVEITPDVGAAYTVTNLSPLPVDDAVALSKALDDYDRAYQAGKATEANAVTPAATPVANGTVLLPPTTP